MMARPLISVVVPSFRRPDLLGRCLDALCAQTLSPQCYEVIVCDDGPDDSTMQTVLVRAARVGAPRIRYAPVRDTRGPAGARNVGWRLAQAPIVAFTDDDTIADPAWLARGLAAMKGGVDAISGGIVMPMPEVPSDYELDASHLQEAEFATANCMVRRDVLEKLGGFDARYTLAWREDSDLHFALLESGCRVLRVPQAFVLHPLRPARYAQAVGVQRKVMFDTLLFKKYPRLYRQRIRPGPPWLYLSMCGLIILAVGAALVQAWALAATASCAWLVLTLWLSLKRLEGTRHDAAHIAEMVLTSIAIPPVSVFWRIVGSVKFRKGFP
jgi:glycosyltransferase involved in cell wall biosynthesis